MFTPEDRAELRSALLDRARGDSRISGAALTGSAASDREDRWSDIDLAFGVAGTAAVSEVLADWTAHMYERHEAVHHWDMQAGAWIYRVFLLASTLQVDLAFVPAAEFRALAPTFRLVFGQANEARHIPPPAAADLIGLAWLYALHARSAIARRKWWQAEYMIGGVRNNALALAAVRHGLLAVHARGIDQLPQEALAPFEASLVRQLDAAELARAFSAVLAALLAEIRHADAELAKKLEGPLLALAESAAGSSGAAAVPPR